MLFFGNDKKIVHRAYHNAHTPTVEKKNDIECYVWLNVSAMHMHVDAFTYRQVHRFLQCYLCLNNVFRDIPNMLRTVYSVFMTGTSFCVTV